ncbi:Hypothetical protein PHPALM_8599 [Phytophthora palmivora]|uniref:PiggyBac transposable element-derived protein domain-containing protein n=1 Tax=Phytophthora palmivora TaxID=4796 RepID=A0A2P4Y9G4_9STRA|nr:Hypothetical protein PHPALM_8599 [Phytophthora palmivora]
MTRTDRLGWCAAIQFSQKKRPKSMTRGTCRIAQALHHLELVALCWMDSQPVNKTAAPTRPQCFARRKTDDEAPFLDLMCSLPKILQAAIPGCGRHGRRQWVYHPQIIQKWKGLSPATHAKYLRRLHTELLGLQSSHFQTNLLAEDLVTVPVRQQEHKLENVEDRYRPDVANKHRQHLCKVCSAFAPPQTKSIESMWYCPRCSESFGGHVPLCIQVRRIETGNTLTYKYGTKLGRTALLFHLHNDAEFGLESANVQVLRSRRRIYL